MARPPRPGAHEALLEAAREEFARRGLAGARVEDMARRAGLSKGAFYLHFRSKDEAFEAIVQRFLGALEEQAQRRHQAEESFARAHAGVTGPALRLAQIELECASDTELLELLWRNRLILAALDGAGSSRYARIVAETRGRMRALVGSRIAERQASGQIRPDLDPTVVADVVVGTYEGFARRMVDLRTPPDLGAWTRSFLTILYEGLLERPAAAAPGPSAAPAAPAPAPARRPRRRTG